MFAGSAIAQILPFGQPLSFGDEGDAVRALQTQLRARGFFDGPITGFYGELTQDAVTRLQRLSGLEQDGVFGARSEDALFGRPVSQNAQVFAPVPPTPGVVVPTPIGVQPPPSPGFPIAVDPVTEVAQLPDPDTASCAAVVAPVSGLADVGTLQQGDIGDSVGILQRRLNELGFNAGSVDEVFGPNTESAVRLFQQSRNLPISGIVDEETARLLGLAFASDDQPQINTGPYAVVVPASRDDLEILGKVRLEVPSACFARSRLGSYIYAGGFPSRSSAESISLRLRSLDLDSRVDFRRRVRSN